MSEYLCTDNLLSGAIEARLADIIKRADSVMIDGYKVSNKDLGVIVRCLQTAPRQTHEGERRTGDRTPQQLAEAYNAAGIDPSCAMAGEKTDTAQDRYEKMAANIMNRATIPKIKNGNVPVINHLEYHGELLRLILIELRTRR